jgi:hypothetical protein
MQEVSQYPTANYTIIAVKTVQYWHKSRYEDQWNRIKMNPQSYVPLIFHRGSKNI